MPPLEQYLEVWLCIRLQGKRFLAPPVVTEELGGFLWHTIDKKLHMHHFLLRVDHLDSQRHGDLVFADARMLYAGRMMERDMEPRRLIACRIRHSATPP